MPWVTRGENTEQEINGDKLIGINIMKYSPNRGNDNGYRDV